MTSILGTAAILFVLEELQFIFGGSPPLLLFLVVIASAAWYGGTKAGLFTTVLSAVTSVYFLTEPYNSFYIARPSEMLRIATLVGIGTVCTLVIARLHDQEKRALHTVMDREEQLKKEIARRNRTQAERNLYVSLAKSSTEFIGMCDTQLEPFFVNDAGLQLVGLDSLEQALKTPVKDFFFPEDQAFIMDEFFPTVLRDSRAEIEIRFRHFKTGEVLWMIFNVFALKDLHDNIVGFGTVSTNITEHKQIEEALRESQRDLNHAQAVAHIGNWRMDIRNNILEWSDENFRIFGTPKGTPLTYQSFLDIVHPADRQLVDTTWQQALTGMPYDIEHRLIVDKKVKWVRELAELEFDKHGVLLGGFGTTEDITDIKSTQEALQYERAFLRQIIDAVPSMIFVKDREGRFMLSNEALAQCYGTSPESLTGLTDENFNPNADEVTHFYQNDLDVIRTGKPKLIPEEKVTHADGSVHWYSTVKIPLCDTDNSCSKLLGVATDITERKHAEETLRLMDRRKDEFLAMLAHELRNPLAPIRNAVRLLKMQEATDPKLTLSCNIIDRQVTHMTRLLDDLLDMARIMQGKIRLKIEHFELTDIVNNAIETSRPLLESRKQELIISQTMTPQWLEGDHVRLAQVLSNLLNNAAKYTGEGGKIMLSVMRKGSDAVIEIKDTGIGISPDILPQIFDLFTQADHTLAHSQGGLGIGLTLVRQLVEIHGGTVTAASEGIGQGSTFTVRLPALPMDSSAAESARTESVLPTSKFRILVVDDYADAAESLMMLLQAKGHEVEIADCGIKAIEQAQVFHPQVVLLDIGLPDLDGYEVAKRLRALPETRDATLIALTGYGQSEDHNRSQSAGFDHHLLKPLNFDELSALLTSS
ncbi:PAS domain S-box protein [Methylobacter tundripaludum]|uniref:histidine kinase n=1 Tax=Methylobacter tundripaludum (strain ATCC BAA-1195 / DSM 17260 / SV96) TaxID=697282 RepID=G3J0I1_METTV|nr:PAS domain S-box protein [Methylobacter tundripaludum]EGW20703.1 multi-sensor hybrid histidine kinase [Methylobacter tundripaludum SV96]